MFTTSVRQPLTAFESDTESAGSANTGSHRSPASIDGKLAILATPRQQQSVIIRPLVYRTLTDVRSAASVLGANVFAHVSDSVPTQFPCDGELLAQSLLFLSLFAVAHAESGLVFLTVQDDHSSLGLVSALTFGVLVTTSHPAADLPKPLMRALAAHQQAPGRETHGASILSEATLLIKRLGSELIGFAFGSVWHVHFTLRRPEPTLEMRTCPSAPAANAASGAARCSKSSPAANAKEILSPDPPP